MSFFRKDGKFMLSVLLIAELFAVSVTPASAGLFGGGGGLPGMPGGSGGVSMPSAPDLAGQMESRYHVDVESIQSQSEALNVADNKKTVPEVSLYFSPTDPKEGQALTATALPVYFSNKPESLYYTWYLFRKDCDKDTCDYNNDGKYDEEDWKIEAGRILARNGFESESVLATDTDDDGYQAKFGGGDQVGVPNHCFIHEASTGVNYELVSHLSGSSNACSGRVVCLTGQGQLNPQTLNLNATAAGGSGTGDTTTGTGTGGSATATASGSLFDTSDTNQCYVTGFPSCTSKSLKCDSGIVSCVPETSISKSGAVACSGNLNNPAMTDLTCSVDTEETARPYCKHLFPNAPNFTSGDGSFGLDEEGFWGTDPSDPSTANNGNKDEANVVGLGQTKFTWNYVAGDKVGVAVEGTSMIQTKDDDASSMIMWAFPKKNCSALDLAKEGGAYTKSIKGYSVTIPAVTGVDLNKCFGKNLVDPTESVTDANLEVTVDASPENVVNDANGEESGDTVTAQASINNGHGGLAGTSFDWDVYMSGGARFDPAGTGVNKTIKVTDTLRAMGLLGNTKGNALDTVSVKLNIPQAMLNSPEMFGDRDAPTVNNVPETVYVKFSVKATENVSAGVTRKGRGETIVRFTSTGRKINAYIATAEPKDTRSYVSIGSDPICNGTATDKLDRRLCRVLKNEIIGLKVFPADGLTDFRWTINGSALSCSKSVSALCAADQQNSVNFFPVTGNVGDTYTVTVAANDVATGRAVTFSRAFNVVEPTATIVSTDKASLWPKLLGQYKDITGLASENCPDGLCDDYSTSISQAFAGSTVGMKVEFIPSFIGATAQRAWSIDDAAVAETATTPGEISFALAKSAGSITNVTLNVLYAQSEPIRKALYDIWNISPLDSSEFRFTVSNQVEILDATATASGNSDKKFLAAIASYLPASVIFAFRMMLSAALILFATGFIFALIPEQDFRRKDL